MVRDVFRLAKENAPAIIFIGKLSIADREWCLYMVTGAIFNRYFPCSSLQ